MDFNKILQQMDKARKSETDGLTIGEIMSKLVPFENEVELYFSNGKYFDGSYDSYRGYYADMYIGYSDKNEGFNTVGDLRETIKEALNNGGMEGYKGGEYSIYDGTLVWFATYGTTNGAEMITNIQEVEGKAVVFVVEVD